jgi:hypothetical protein
MRLRIEPPGATRASYGRAARPGDDARGARILDLIVERQLRDKWCWAAVAAALGRYYGTRTLAQRDAAAALLGVDGDDGNRYAMLDDALRLAGCFSHWSPGRPTYERICDEIDAGRPVCVRIQWRDGGSHYVVLTGHDRRTGELYVQDPQHGPSIHPFEAFPRQYRIGAVWTETYWTGDRST